MSDRLDARVAARVALGFLLLALIVRAPALILPSLDRDEGLYLTIASELNQGRLPYVGPWDQKPIGIFLLFAAVERVFADGVLGVRLLGSLFTALAAFALYRIATRLFDPGAAPGLAAGVAYVLFSTENSGLASNTEVFYIPLTLCAAALLLTPAAGGAGRTVARDLAAGLLLGLAVQIKQVVLFDLAAFLAGYAIVTSGVPFARRVRRDAIRFVVVAVGIAVPTLAVAATYASLGHFDAFWDANVSSNAQSVVRSFGSPRVVLFAAINHGPLWLGAVLALGFGRGLTAGARERRALVACATWILAILLGLLMLRRWYEHYFIQCLPPLCLLSGFVVARTLSGLGRPARSCAAALLAVSAFAAANKLPFLAAGDLVAQRRAGGDRATGDVARLAARDVRRSARPGDAIFVFDQDPVVYYLSGAEPATRFVLPAHWYRGASARFDPFAELERLLATRPRFIVTRDSAFDDVGRPGIDDTPAGEGRRSLAAGLAARLAAEIDDAYEPVGSHDAPVVWGGRAVGIKPWGARVYRRRGN